MSDSPIKKDVTIGDCRLILGDCLEVMPLLGKVDAVVTDPPYGIEDMVGGYGREGKTIKNDKNLDVVSEAFRIIGMRWTDLWVAAFYSPRVEVEFQGACSWLTRRGTLIWDKKAPGMGAGIRYQHESIAMLSGGNPKGVNPTFSVLRYYRSAEQHPHQKPLELMKHMVGLFEAETALDPFMGSGTTGVACAKMGRKFIGIELDPEYFEIACDRIRKAYDQPDMFVEQPKKPEATQSDIFSEAE